MIASLGQRAHCRRPAAHWTGLSRVTAVCTEVATLAILSSEQVLDDGSVLKREGSMVLQAKERT